MRLFRWILLPVSLLYGIAVTVRNFLYDNRWLTSYSIPGKSIIIGNLSVGGTGKTPLVIFLADYFRKGGIPVATLSRGYGRKTKGYIAASRESTATQIGDEPRQYVERFGSDVSVSVCEDRKQGVLAIRKALPDNTVILLDDAFQHRKVRGGLSILVTEYSRPFNNDFLLPVGRLRETRSGAHRADIIIVSKCPQDLSDTEKKYFERTLTRPGQYTFFSSISYGDIQQIATPLPKEFSHVILVTGIGNPKPLLNYLKAQYQVTHLSFPDHHNYTASDIDKIHQKFNTFASHDTIIVTTEKDYMRLRQFKRIADGSMPWFYQPIDITIDKETQFKHLLDSYVRKD
jgi:tetraacyldisaccharide 4'-kinase